MPHVDEGPAGYAHPAYAESLAEFGRPCALPLSGGSILERRIPESASFDATGCYPFFACRNWSQLGADFANLRKDWVTLSLVADPFGRFTLDGLAQCFDVVMPFKRRFVIDLQGSIDEIGTKHHRYYARKALRVIEVEVCANPVQYLDEWIDLYSIIIRKFRLNGIRAFSKAAFEKQLGIPGMIMFRAACAGQTVGLDLWFVYGGVAYGHLAAYNELGYKMRASYAVKWTLIRHFAGKVDWIDLGGAPGIQEEGKTGLTQYKEGWATGTRQTYFCGRILDRKCYSDLVQSRHLSEGTFFPIYRQGEFD